MGRMVTVFGMALRESEMGAGAGYPLALELAQGAVGWDPGGYRTEFLELAKGAKELAGKAMAPCRDPKTTYTLPMTRLIQAILLVVALTACSADPSTPAADTLPDLHEPDAPSPMTDSEPDAIPFLPT